MEVCHGPISGVRFGSDKKGTRLVAMSSFPSGPVDDDADADEQTAVLAEVIYAVPEAAGSTSTSDRRLNASPLRSPARSARHPSLMAPVW